MVRILRSDLHALGAQLRDDGLDALLLERTQAVTGHPQGDPALLTLEPETLRMEVRQKPASAAIVRVRYRVAAGGPLAGDLTDFGHDRSPASQGAPRAGRSGRENEPRFIPAGHLPGR